MREPYTVVGYLAQRTPIVKLLNLVHPNDVHPVTKASKGKKYGKVPTSGHVTNPERKWTAWDICDGEFIADYLMANHLVSIYSLGHIQRLFHFWSCTARQL